MSISYSAPQRLKVGNAFINVVKAIVSSDDVYTTGGYTITPKQVGLDQIIGVFGNFSTGHLAVYDGNEVGGKIKAYNGATEELNASTGLQDAIADLVIMGR